MVKVGSMTRAKRILLMASVLVMSLSAANASWFRRKAEAAGAATPSVAGTSLTAVEADASHVLLRTSATPVYTSYSPAPDVFVVDLASTTKGASVAVPATLPAGITSISAEDAVEMGTRLTRVTFRLAQPATLQASVSENSVVITVPQVPPPAVAVTGAESQAAVSGAKAEAPSVEVVAETHPAPVEPVVAAEPLPVSANKAKVVKRVEAAGTGSAFEVTIAGDGALSYKSFVLENPSRLVIDLNGVKNASSKPSLTVADAIVKRVRVAQFKGAPDPVTRVVLDLDSKAEYHIIAEGDRLHVSFGAHSPVVEPATVPASAVAVAEQPKTVKPATSAATSKGTAADIPSQIPTIAEDASWKVPAESTHGAKARITAESAQTAPDTTKRTRSTGTMTTSGAGATSAAAQAAGENVFTDAQPASPAAGAPSQVLSSTPGGGRNLSGGQKVYSGEPISLNLKDADIKDVLRTFAELTGLNIAIDPEVTGSVTVNFVDVPWDQALELILRQNGLTYVLDGNVMRVGKLERIASEVTAQRRIEEENRLNVPLTTLGFKLSYARATEVQALVQQLASPRARIIVDQRTNQLIISEIPQYLQTIRNLIETVDVPTRQVMIEARIVEASKVFQQQYGFSWGFEGALDPALGTGTGLIFPNRVGYTGGPFNFGPGNPVLALTLTDVLGSFNLNFALNAFEFEGLVKVISAPRVTTQDNVAAEIQSGFQIPYQTRVNFTTTVTYVDATLRLSVTPQITEAGTVIMDISVQKNEPTTGLAIAGAAGTPLSTRSARTKLMVRDGGTAVIGGIYQVKDNDSRTRLPFVHNIPVIGNLFKTHDISTSHDELLIFITPRIIRGA
jgi:type IV pilus secretin PilQ/predicted competence protein